MPLYAPAQTALYERIKQFKTVHHSWPSTAAEVLADGPITFPYVKEGQKLSYTLAASQVRFELKSTHGKHAPIYKVWLLDEDPSDYWFGN